MCFAGFGRHLANDFCHILGLFPSTPTCFICICEDDDLYTCFCSAIPQYISIWQSEDYLHRCCGPPNSSNPLAFNVVLDTYYKRQYLLVFGKKKVVMDAGLYNAYLSQGFFDPEHKIGKNQSHVLSPQNNKIYLWRHFFAADHIACLSFI